MVTDDLLATLEAVYENVNTPPVLSFLDYHEDAMALLRDAIPALKDCFPRSRYAVRRQTDEHDELLVLVWFAGEVHDALDAEQHLRARIAQLPYDTVWIPVYFDIAFL